MAVEVIQGSMNTFDFQAYSRIDNYAVGLVLWELLSRTQPPPGTDPSECPSDAVSGLLDCFPVPIAFFIL